MKQSLPYCFTCGFRLRLVHRSNLLRFIRTVDYSKVTELEIQSLSESKILEVLELIK